MRCPNCDAEDPAPLPSDDNTTTCPRCGHRFPITEETEVRTPDPNPGNGPGV